MPKPYSGKAQITGLLTACIVLRCFELHFLCKMFAMLTSFFKNPSPQNLQSLGRRSSPPWVSTAGWKAAGCPIQILLFSLLIPLTGLFWIQLIPSSIHKYTLYRLPSRVGAELSHIFQRRIKNQVQQMYFYISICICWQPPSWWVASTSAGELCLAGFALLLQVMQGSQDLQWVPCQN